MNKYEKAREQAANNHEEFWGNIAEDCFWFKKWDKVLDDTNKPFYRWFPGGVTNTCYNALDLHVEKGFGRQPALIYDSPVTGAKKQYTYLELRDKVSLFAGILADIGVVKGDRVVIYMPMVPEAVIAMLACARLGVVHSVVFGGFAAKELATRINDAKPKVIVSASCGIEVNRVIPYKPLLDKAIEMADSKPEHCIILQRPQERAEMVKGRDHDWTFLMTVARPHSCVPVASTDPLYILYTSGTTGVPKGVVRDNGGHMAAQKWVMKAVYNMERGDVFWAASDVGWVVGHSYIVYGPLLKGCTTLLFEGKPVRTPDPGVFWRIISEYKIKALSTAPTALRAIKREDPAAAYAEKYDLSCLKAIFLAGERSDPDTIKWAEKHFNVPIVDHWWQTESGWAIASSCLGLHQFPIKPGSPTKAAPGWDVQVLDNQGNQVAAGETGTLAIKLPLPPGSLPTLWKNEEGYIKSYLSTYEGYYNTGDAGYIDEDGYVYVMSRTDDIINVAGHRLSTGGMEEVLANHPDVAECAVLGVADKLKGQVPIGFLVLKDGTNKDHDEIIKETVQMVRNTIGPVAAFKKAVIVNMLPKTRSGKILRGIIQKIAENRDYNMPATIDNPEALKEIGKAVKTIGYGESSVVPMKKKLHEETENKAADKEAVINAA